MIGGIDRGQGLTEIPNMKFAKYFKTVGTCCWKLYPKKNYSGKRRTLIQGGAKEDFMQPTTENGRHFFIKSVQMRGC